MRLQPTKQAKVLQELLSLGVTGYLLLKTLISEIPKTESNKSNPLFPRYKIWELEKMIKEKTQPEIIKNFYPIGLRNITVRKMVTKLGGLRILYIEKTPSHNDMQVSLNNKYCKAIIDYHNSMTTLIEFCLKEYKDGENNLEEKP